MGVAAGHMGCNEEECCENRKIRHLQKGQADRAVERMLEKLFSLHDPDGRGAAPEAAVVELVARMVALQQGVDLGEAGQDEVRSRLGHSGQPVSFASFQTFVADALRSHSHGTASQCSVLEQLISERVDQNLAEMTEKLFRVQDLNDDGFLEESELVQLNKKVAMLHYGKDIDKEEVSAKYKDLFRSKLDASGSPVSLARFRRHILSELEGIDADRVAQCSILEQWILEAISARLAFRDPSMQSLNDLPFLLLGPLELKDLGAFDDSAMQVSTPPVAAHGPVPRAPVPSEMGTNSNCNSGFSRLSGFSRPEIALPSSSKFQITTLEAQAAQAMHGGA